MEDFDSSINEVTNQLLAIKKILGDQGIKHTDDLDLYLIDNLFPVLFPGLEELSKEVERYQDKKNVIDEHIRDRFNPCLYLAQYLMRNNPKYNQENFENNEFRNYSERLRKIKTLDGRKEQLKKYFAGATNNAGINMKAVESIVKKCDESLHMSGDLLADMHLTPKIIAYKESKSDIPIDEFFVEFKNLLVKSDVIKDLAIREKMLPALGLK